MAAFELELPAAYADAAIEDEAASIVGKTPTLINLSPERGEDLIARDSDVQFDLATVDATGTIDSTSLEVYINGVAAVLAGVAQSGFTRTLSNPQADVLRVIVSRTADFLSEEVVSARVKAYATSDSANVLDETYNFMIEDYAAPRILQAEAVDLQRVRVTFDESVIASDTTELDSALRPGNWVIDRFGDYLTPLVSVIVESVEVVTSSTVDLITDIPLTPGGTYRVTAANIEDTSGNAVVAPDDVATFLGWQPPVPEGRLFDLYRKLPSLNRQEDASKDLFRFVACIQEVANLLLYDIDKWIEIIDPDTAPEDWLDSMLLDLGNPFEFELTLTDKRRLAQVLVDMYRLKGTKVGIESVIRFFLGLEVTVDTFNGASGTWVMGESELGIDSVLGTSDIGLLYSFIVSVGVALTDTQRDQLRGIVEYMKPAHTHFIRLDEPVIPTVLDHLELGLSELGENWFLH